MTVHCRLIIVIAQGAYSAKGRSCPHLRLIGR